MKQITVLAPSRDSIIADITGLLADFGINIDGIDAEHYGSQVIVILIVDAVDDALAVLQRRTDWQVVCEDALLIKIRDERGALAKISRRLADAGIAIRSLRFIERYDGFAIAALSADRMADARALLDDMSLSGNDANDPTRRKV